MPHATTRIALAGEYLAASYSVYEWYNNENEIYWNLISNVCKKEEDGLQSSGSLFHMPNKVLKTYHLLPEYKNVDYLIKISNDTQYFNEKVILGKICHRR